MDDGSPIENESSAKAAGGTAAGRVLVGLILGIGESFVHKGDKAVSEELIEAWVWDGKQDVYRPLLESELKKPIPIAEVVDWLFATENKHRIQSHLTRYFSSYRGRYFEWFIKQSDPRIFTPWDILAVETLSVSVPTETARWFLEPNEVRDYLLAESLLKIDSTGNSLWACDEKLLNKGGALSDLYMLMREKDGLGYVTTSKLLATKFPAVVPIRDSQVENLLDLGRSKEWWSPIRQLFTSSDQSLDKYLNEFNVPNEIGFVTPLRRLDVVLWMEAKARKFDSPKREMNNN